MSRIMIPDSGPGMGRVPVEEDSDSDDSGDEGQGMRIAADPSPMNFPKAKFAQDREAAASAPAPAPAPADKGFAAPAPPSTTFAVPPRKKSDFIPSATFSGPKPGFVYKKGPDGLGYYKDANFAQNNVGTALTNASRPGSGLPAPKSSESRDMLQLLKQKELEENSKPKSSVIPTDGDSDEEDETPKRQNSGGMFSKLTKRISKSAEEIRANIQKRKAEEGATAPEEPMAKPDTPRPGNPSRPSGPSPPPVFAQPPAIQRPTPPQRQAPPQPKATPTNSAPAAAKKPQRESPDQVLEIVCEDLGFGLPSAVMGLEGFSNVVRAGNLLFTSSHGPQLPTQGYVRGRLGEGSMTVDSAQVAASLTTLSLLKSLINELGGLDSVKGVVKITAQVACVDEKSTTDLVSIFEPMRNVLRAIFSCNEPVISVSGVTCLPHEIPLQAEAVFELM